MAQPGIFWLNSKTKVPDFLTKETLKTWYGEVRVPKVVATSSTESALRYKSTTSEAEYPYLALYPILDVNQAPSEKLDDITQTTGDEDVLSNGDCSNHADFDGRIYEFVQLYEKHDSAPGPARVILSAGLTPATGTDADFDAWYREEHLAAVSKCSGYVRTRRYILKTALTAENAATYLALHEFDSETLPEAELIETGKTPWAAKILGSILGMEAAVYSLISE